MLPADAKRRPAERVREAQPPRRRSAPTHHANDEYPLGQDTDPVLMPLLLLATAFTIFTAILAVRRGDASRWLWIILLFGPIGSAVYLFAEYFDGALPQRSAFRQRKVTAEEVHAAEAEVRRLDSAPAWIDYASLLRQRKDHARAAEAAGRALERDPDSLDARYELGLSLLAAGQHSRAVEALELVVAAEPRYDSDDALYALARARLGAADVKGASANLEELAARRGRPEILYDLAYTQANLGNGEAALRSLQRILDEAELVPEYLQSEVKPWVRRARSAIKKLSP